MKEKEGNDYGNADSWDGNNFGVGGKEGAEGGNNERDEGDGNENDGENKDEEEEGKGDGSRM